MAVVSPGFQPKTRLQKMTILESGSEAFFYDADMEDVEKRGLPIVLAYNGMNHYCPALRINNEEFIRWQLQQVSKVSVTAVTLINEVDIKKVTKEQGKGLQDLEKQLRTTINLLKQDPEPETRGSRSLRTVLFSSPFAEDEDAATAPGPSAAPSSSAARPVGRKLKFCEVSGCLYQTFRSQDLKSHYWSVHNDDVRGVRIECTEGTCAKKDKETGVITGKKFSSKANLKKHTRTEHMQVYTYHCKTCGFHTEAKLLWEDHLLKHKKKKVKFTCKKCNKSFAGKANLKRHTVLQSCTLKKNFQCSLCGKWLKRKEGLLKHKSLFHDPDNPLLECTICEAKIAGAVNMSNHQALHRAGQVLAAARKSRALQEKRKKQSAARLAAIVKRGGIKKPAKKPLAPVKTAPSSSKGAEEEEETERPPMVQESVPAKLLPRRSARNKNKKP